ncbi:alpha/beta hydrolase fold domain-containing protein [Jannaschia pohangensis]|uniref:alpha/beta hydrolase fold domain-containing protein n=1 Tax=Jannaschia pohangensis TaxID=390807 RepID=UPI001587D4B2|nr:alpha/beta hydrolase fold domain-containing protein [Jannaschia pohangensis]
MGGVPCRAFGKGAPVLWLHGGGYVFGDSRSHAACAAHLARAAARQVIVPDYRLAPEYPWPAPLDDVRAVLRALPHAIPVVGDSAGGHLALNLALCDPTRVTSLALISPNTDRTGQSDTRRANEATDLMNDDATDARLAQMAMPHLPPDDPAVSPRLANLRDLPPTYLTASRAEVLAGDATLLAHAARDQGVPVAEDWQDDLFHMWTLWPDALPEARATLTRIAHHIA